MHQNFPDFFLLQATNAWQELLSCQNPGVKIKVTQLPVVWRVTSFKESHRLPFKGLFAWRWGTPGRPSRARKIACVYEQFLQPQDTWVRLLALVNVTWTRPWLGGLPSLRRLHGTLRPWLIWLPYPTDRATSQGRLPHLSCKRDQDIIKDFIKDGAKRGKTQPYHFILWRQMSF